MWHMLIVILHAFKVPHLRNCKLEYCSIDPVAARFRLRNNPVACSAAETRLSISISLILSIFTLQVIVFVFV